MKSTRSPRSSASAAYGQQDIELQHLAPPHQGPETVTRRKRHQPPKQLFSADDESLPKTTRAVLRFLYWAFEVLFWFLGVVVQVLAAGVVGAGKLVAKL